MTVADHAVETPSYDHIDVAPMSPTIGGVVADIDLRTVDEAAVAELRRAFLDRGVLFFRDQHLTAEEQIAFAAHFGDPEIYPFKKNSASFSEHPSGLDQIVRLEHDEKRPGYENAWHSDVTWMVEPSLGSVLLAIEVPETGGDTLFSDGRAAYLALAPEFRSYLDTLRASHDWLGAFGRNFTPDGLKAQREVHPGAVHPIVRTHPETGRKSLYVTTVFLQNVVGLSRLESDHLIAHLMAQVARPEFQCRWKWEPGSVAMWDNRCVLHYAVQDYYPQRRVMDRVTIKGDAPI